MQPRWFVLTLEHFFFALTKLQNESVLQFVQWIGFKTPHSAFEKHCTRGPLCSVLSSGVISGSVTRNWGDGRQQMENVCRTPWKCIKTRSIEQGCWVLLFFLCYKSGGKKPSSSICVLPGIQSAWHEGICFFPFDGSRPHPQLQDESAGSPARV